MIWWFNSQDQNTRPITVSVKIVVSILPPTELLKASDLAYVICSITEQLEFARGPISPSFAITKDSEGRPSRSESTTGPSILATRTAEELKSDEA